LTGFGEVHIVDLDTIDLSNLNRQFLFRHEHIKKPKALVRYFLHPSPLVYLLRTKLTQTQVAKEVASKFNPSCILTAHHANIKDTQAFPLSFFRSFTLVFNALDNLDARRHVNKMCLAADVPLIESGTTGFNGQVQVIKKGKTACYDCTEKEVPKTYPVCTIRSTPSQPIHCIVWAKSYLLPELFGVSEDEETPAQLDTSEDADNAQEIQNLKAEAQALKEIRESMYSDDFAQKVFDKVFKEDIDRLRGMEDMWKSRKPPTSLDYQTLQSEASTSTDATISSSDQNPWTLIENFAIFKDSLQRLSNRLRKDTTDQTTESSQAKPIITFDKDDADTLDFVTSTSNLRSHIFSIPAQSKFTIKQMAGNIIPAIATTNAMTAGLCVMQAFKVLRGDYFRTKMLFLENSGARALNSEPPRAPNPDCAVCGIATAQLDVDPERACLADLVDGVLRAELGYGDELTVMNELGPIYDPDMEDMLVKTLADLGVGDQSFLTVIDDEEENPRVNLQLAVSSARKLPVGSRAVVLATAAMEDGDGDGDGDGGRAARLEIARKPRKAAGANNSDAMDSNLGLSHGNSASVLNGAPKRSAAEAGLDEPDIMKAMAAAEAAAAAAAAAADADISAAKPSSAARNGVGVSVNNHADTILLDDGAGGDGSIVIEDDD
jgi:ubiquitin-like 1-activating enzyme E1 B